MNSKGKSNEKNNWYYTPEQAMGSFFRSRFRGILPYFSSAETEREGGL